MNKKSILIAAGLGFVQLTISQRANAQDSLKLKDVVITATKNGQKQSQTGKVVTIIGKEVLDRSHGKSLPELLNEQAGIVVSGATGNPGQNKSVFFRGAASGYTVVLIDGIVQNDPSGNGGAFDLRQFSIDQIDHIEILRGGQSTIYGSDAVAGVINIVTRKGGPKGNTIYGVASAGSYESYKGTIGLNGGLEGFSYNVNYTHNKTDGISEAAAPVGSSAVLDKDGFKTDGINANFGIQLDKNFSVNPFLRYFYGNYKIDEDAFVDGFPENHSILKQFSGGVNTVYKFSTGKITLNYSYEKTSNDTQSSFMGFPSNYSSEGRINILDLFYNQKISNKLDLLLGVDNRALKLINGSNSPKTNIFATYGSLFLHDLSIFNLELGGRYNKHDQYGENYTYTITPTINIIKKIKLFGTVSTAFKVPTLSMLFGQFGANLNLKPEKSQNYEAGANFSFVDEKLNLRLVAFKRNLKNAILYGATGYDNVASQKDKGFEIEPSLKLSIFNFNGYYAYVEGTNGTINYLIRRPKHTFGLNAGIQATKNLYVSANYRYFGKRFDTNFSTYTVEELPSYKLLSAYAEYALFNKNFRIFFDAKNILNKKYNEFIGYSTMGFNFNTGVSFNIR